MTRNNYSQLIFTVKETRRQLDLGEISPDDAKVIFGKLMDDFKKISSDFDSKEFDSYCKLLFS